MYQYHAVLITVALIWASDKLQLCCFFLKTALATQDLWWFHIHFRFICSIFMKNVMGKMSCINM